MNLGAMMAPPKEGDRCWWDEGTEMTNRRRQHRCGQWISVRLVNIASVGCIGDAIAAVCNNRNDDGSSARRECGGMDFQFSAGKKQTKQDYSPRQRTMIHLLVHYQTLFPPSYQIHVLRRLKGLVHVHGMSDQQ
jgi:hypothetical protein